MSTTFIYYETIDADAGLLTVTDEGVSEVEDGEYGTLQRQSYESFDAFLQGAGYESVEPEELQADDDGFYHPDAYIKFKVIQGTELPTVEWNQL